MKKLILALLLFSGNAHALVKNSDIAANAAIALSKLAPVTVSRVACSSASGFIVPCSMPSSYLDATSSIQTQLDSKQATDAELSAIAGLTSAADKIPYFTGLGTASLADFSAAGRALVDDASAAAQRTTLGSTTVGDAVFIAADAAAARTAIGLGTSDNPQFTTIELGAASDTTIARSSAGNVSVEGNLLYRAGGTDVPIADGGTGASTKAAAFDALSPMTTAGDFIYGGASGTGTRLPKGSDTQIMTMVSGSPAWAAPAAAGALTKATKTSAYTVNGEDVIFLNGTFTLTLEAAASRNKVLRLINIGTGIVTVLCVGSDKIGNALVPTDTTMEIPPGMSAPIVSDDVLYYRIAD